MLGTTKDRNTFGFLRQPLGRLIDDVDRHVITSFGVVSPSEQTMALQHNAIRIRIFKAEFF